MIRHIQNISEEVAKTLSAEERMVIVLLYVERLCVAEASEVLEMPPERVIAIAALVKCRVRMAITGGLRDRAVPLWDQRDERDASFVPLRRLPRRGRVMRRPAAPRRRPHRRTAP